MFSIVTPLSIIFFLLFLSFLVLIHELGHFLTAKLFRVKVKEFAIGFPPKIKTLFHWMGVPFVLNSLPLGGYVQMVGENGEGQEDPEDKAIPGEPFYSRPAWQRMIIILAGATVNFVFGVLAFIIVFAFSGIPQYALEITGVAEGSPAAAVLRSGDRITAIGTNEQAVWNVDRSYRFIRFVSDHRGKDVVVRVERAGETLVYTLRVRTPQETPAGQGSLGVEIRDQYTAQRYPWYQMPIAAFQVGIQESIGLTADLLASLRGMVRDIATFQKVPTEVAGPVGILDQTIKQEIFFQGPLTVLYFAGLFSINLAIMNVLPIPALDGGRAVFIILEQIIGRKRQAKAEALAHQIGFAFLIGLIILITIKDILVLVRG